jgi:hypothetical protein
MVDQLATHARNTPRVWRLFLAAFWRGHLRYVRRETVREVLLQRLAELEHWADTGCPPRQQHDEVFMASSVEEARRVTIGVCQQPGSMWKTGHRRQSELVREIFGNPFRQVAFFPSWRTDTALSLARQMYESQDFSAMPILADALQDAGCDSADILAHCRGPGPHVRGCWVVDLVLGKS